MKIVSDFEFQTGSREERLPGFAKEFPYIAVCSELDSFARSYVPWHWHKAVELFYMERGTIEYFTPTDRKIIPTGYGGMLNANVLHMTKLPENEERNTQLLHIFNPDFLSGAPGSLIEQKYITPLITASQIELVLLNSNVPEQKRILLELCDAFRLDETAFGYELRLREQMTKIWLNILDLCRPIVEKPEKQEQTNDKIKQMMTYIYDHFGEKIDISMLAESGYCSQRECYRTFQDCLRMTPVEYIRSYRLRIAANLLVTGNQSITDIAHACGFGSNSYFGKLFREVFKASPMEYRLKWQNRNTK